MPRTCFHCGKKLGLILDEFEIDGGRIVCNKCWFKYYDQTKNKTKQTYDPFKGNTGSMNNEQMPHLSPTNDTSQGLSRIFSSSGRCNRTEYIVIIIIEIVIALIASGIISDMIEKIGYWGYGPGLKEVLAVFAVLVGFIIHILATIRRLHDMGYPGSYYFLLFLPPANIIAALWIMFAPGTEGNNQYGRTQSVPNITPNTQSDNHTVENTNEKETKPLDEEKIINLLERLANLKSQGAITEEEYEKRKKALIG